MTGNRSGYPLYFHGIDQAVQGDLDRIAQQIQNHLVSAASLYQLPPDLEDFTGRSTELQQIFDLINQSIYERKTSATVIAITGKAGVGKSTFAIHLAHRLKSSFLDAQLYVNLHGTEQHPKQPKAVLGELLRRWGVDADQIPSQAGERLDLLQSQLMDKQTLLVLDNAVNEEQVRSLIPRHCCSVVLITSRHSLADLDRVAVLHLPELPDAEAIALLYRLINKETIQLPPETAQSLVQRCHCLPLSIRLVASAIQRQLSKPISEQFEQFDRLYQQVHSLRLSHAEVRPSFLFDYQQLSPEAARLLRLLGLLAESHFTSTIAAVLLEAKPDDAEQFVGELVDLKLIRRIGGGHYQIVHDIVRLLARGQLALEESSAMRQLARMRVSQWYLETGQMMLWGLNPQTRNVIARIADRMTQQPIAKLEQQLVEGSLNWFEAERSNLLTVVEWAVQADDPDRLIALVGKLALFFDYSDDWESWEQTHKLALNAARQLGDAQPIAHLMNNLANAYLRQGRLDQAKELYKQSISLYESLGEVILQAKTLFNLGNLYINTEQLQSAARCWKSAIDCLPEDSNERHHLQQQMQQVQPYLWQQIGETEADRSQVRGLFQSVGAAIWRFISE
ncbi:tetratricopeptide repeat protein [Egbenema bharatensis]|uniref:tetratricopeptide repeat protein n=1 Tax=Egbenema bharatensis TaxID=3463334 RepID=UPI003A864B5E